MKMQFTFVAGLMLAGLSGPSLAASHALDGYKADYAAACQANSNAPEALCVCMADQAASDTYTETQRQWLLLTMQIKTDEAAALAATMPATEAAAAASFMVTAPQQCAAAG